MKITVAGTGYVGFSLAVLLAQRHDVTALDVIQSKVDLINSGKSPIVEPNITKLLDEGNLHLHATTDKEEAYSNAELVIIATPTNYNESTKYFDTSSIDDVVENVLKYNANVPMFVKSTVPVGFTESMRSKFNIKNIYFSPEFLREGRSLYDNLHPSRIIVGDKTEVGKMFASLLLEASLDENTPVLYMNPTEAEAVKLFANTYLAMRVAYFDELSEYTVKTGLDTRSIIEGVCADTRVGNGYNNPGFGYGGYCLKKDSKQLRANFKKANVSENLISAIVESNITHKMNVTKDILKKYPTGKIGIYKTAMKANSDNNRSSSIIDVILNLRAAKRDVVIYEPNYDLTELNCEQVDSLEELVNECEVIVTNRVDKELKNTGCKIYTRDIFGDN